MDVAKLDKIEIGDSNYEDETVGRILSKNLNGATGYPISDIRQTFA